MRADVTIDTVVMLDVGAGILVNLGMVVTDSLIGFGFAVQVARSVEVLAGIIVVGTAPDLIVNAD